MYGLLEVMVKSGSTPYTPPSAAASWEQTYTTALSDEVQTVVGMLDMSSPEHRFRVELIKKTKAKVKESFPSCRVEVYGSWETRLALPSSDIDFVVIGCAHIPKDSMLKKVASSFEAIGLKCTALLPSARVPVLKFMCPNTGLRGDLTLDVGNWQNSISLVRDLLNDYSAYFARDIIVLLKLVLVLTSNNEVCKGGLSSYGLCLMVIAYLRRAKEVDKVTPSRGTLLVGFLDHYRTGGTFDPTSMTVDISKPQGFRQGTMRPMSSRYKGSYCVQDPLNSGNNVTEQCFSMSTIADTFLSMWEGLVELRKRGRLPDGGGKMPCGMLRHVIDDLHHFQRQRTQLLERWMAQERWEQALQQPQLHDWARVNPYNNFAAHLGQPMGMMPYMTPGWSPVPTVVSRGMHSSHTMSHTSSSNYHGSGRKNVRGKRNAQNHHMANMASLASNFGANAHPFSHYAHSAYGGYGNQGLVNPFMMFPPYAGVAPVTAMHPTSGMGQSLGGGGNSSVHGSSGADSGSNSDRASESSQDSIGHPESANSDRVLSNPPPTAARVAA